MEYSPSECVNLAQGVRGLEGFYQVYYGREPVGKAELTRQGLYIRIICRCCLPGQQIYRLYATSGAERMNLGVLIPREDGGYLERKIPAKNLPQGTLRFVISAGLRQGQYVPISPEEPFCYIDRLKNAFLDSENGRIGVRIETNPEAV